MNKYKVSDKLKAIVEKNRLARVMANNWIDELKSHGYTYDEMISIFKLAKHKAEILIREKK